MTSPPITRLQDTSKRMVDDAMSRPGVIYAIAVLEVSGKGKDEKKRWVLAVWYDLNDQPTISYRKFI